MNILGVNGLGINPAACLWQNNQLKAFAAEERFNRLKESFGLMPKQAAAFCLKSGQVNITEVDAVAFGWNAPLYNWYMPFFVAKTALQYSSTNADKGAVYKALEQLTKYRPGNVQRALTDMFRATGNGAKIPQVVYYNHHLAHAASAYYTSGFDAAHILVIDGSGENQCTTIFKAEGAQIQLVETLKIPHSLGWFYQSITEWLGFTPNSHEGKTMALAVYGNYDEDLQRKLTRLLQLKQSGSYTYNPIYSFAGRHTKGSIYSDELEQVLGCARNKNEDFTPYHYNVAFNAQYLLEKATSALVTKIARDKTFSGNLCLAGGVALNCKMNGVLMQAEGVKQIFVPPVSSDDGTALGAAMLYAKQKGADPRFSMQHAYYGPTYTDKEIEAVLKQCNLPYTRPENITQTTAELLAQGKIVARFNGGMEVGARALGNRSILAHPAIKGMKNRINAQIKGREDWRPFAVSALFEARNQLVEHACHSPFMTIAFKVRKQALPILSEGVHIDGTTRPQFVTATANADYYNLIAAFEKITGIPALLNTSFNTNEEPVVCSPAQAIKAFYGTGLDALALGNFLLLK